MESQQAAGLTTATLQEQHDKTQQLMRNAELNFINFQLQVSELVATAGSVDVWEINKNIDALENEAKYLKQNKGITPLRQMTLNS